MNMNSNKLKYDIFDVNDPEKQRQAAYKMRYVKNDTEIEDILIRACFEATDIKLQQISVHSISILKPKKAMNVFIQATYDRANAEIRKRAYHHLGTIGRPEVINEVIKGFSDENDMVRKAAIMSAGKLGRDESIIKRLSQLLNRFEPDNIRKEAKKSIDKIYQRLNYRKPSAKNYNHQSFNQKIYENHDFSFRQSYIPTAF